MWRKVHSKSKTTRITNYRLLIRHIQVLGKVNIGNRILLADIPTERIIIVLCTKIPIKKDIATRWTQFPLSIPNKKVAYHIPYASPKSYVREPQHIVISMSMAYWSTWNLISRNGGIATIKPKSHRNKTVIFLFI